MEAKGLQVFAGQLVQSAVELQFNERAYLKIQGEEQPRKIPSADLQPPWHGHKHWLPSCTLLPQACAHTHAQAHASSHTHTHMNTQAHTLIYIEN